MAHQVLRIAGSSYSGSTALGYFLNTFDGFLFGSELYKLLPSFVQAYSPPRITPCDWCGMHCPVWSDTLRASILGKAGSSLADVYEALFREQSAVRVLVDGSKSVRWYLDAPMDALPLTYVVAVKHPLRLLASFVYNDADLIPRGRRDSLEACALYLAQRREDLLRYVDATCVRLRRQYEAIFELAASSRHVVCHTDSADDVQRTLERLAGHYATTFDLARMNAKPCHALGGNRSLVWQVRGYASGPGQPARDQARFEYYREQGAGAIRQDNKYEILFDARTQGSIRGSSAYRALAAVLDGE